MNNSDNKISTTNSSRILRILGQNTSSKGNTANVDELRAIPHIQYLKDFDQVQWSPSVMGLDDIAGGDSPTLVCAPKWAVDWLQHTKCLRENRWDMVLTPWGKKAQWENFAEAPKGLNVSSGFIASGGFINCWEDEDKTHMVWGWVDQSNSSSILAFVWLQNVLAGGRLWRRREIGNLPESFMEVLPIGYICLSQASSSMRVRTLGVHRPIFERRDGKLLGLRDWLSVPRNTSMSADMDEFSFCGLYLPEVSPAALAAVSQGNRYGVVWQRSSNMPKRFISFYPSAFGTKIDLYQDQWQKWLDKMVPSLEMQTKTEVLLCLREAVINADKHGCGGKIGKRLGVVISHDKPRRMLKLAVSDPGGGHRYNMNALLSRQDQRIGRHLGLMLIHGLASVVRFSDEGSTIEFDFTY